MPSIANNQFLLLSILDSADFAAELVSVAVVVGVISATNEIVNRQFATTWIPIGQGCGQLLGCDLSIKGGQLGN